jgi:8-amino-7-oxononanoate synthase
MGTEDIAGERPRPGLSSIPISHFHSPISHSFPWDEGLAERRRRGLYRRRRRVATPQGPRLVADGRELVNFASNDYLNLASDPRLAAAAARAARRYGCGAGASPLVSGWLPPLRALERDLARWSGSEAAVVFSSGFAANLAALTALAGPADAVFSDALNHASLIDGCRLSRAAVHVYRHADISHLAELLGAHGPAARRRFIVSDSVFSMDGDAAPLAGLLALATRHDAVVILDEAHATGVLGERGTGLTGTLVPGSFDPARLVKVGTLSKALGSQGGFICGGRRLIDWLVNAARPYVFSTGLAPPAAAAARRALRVLTDEPERRERLAALSALARRRLREAGWAVPEGPAPIIPLVVGPAREAMRLSQRLRDAGLLVPAIRPPSVPEGTARLRVSLTAGHADEDVARLAAALAR